MHSLSDRSENIAARLLENARRDGFAGYDPFDGLNSQVLKATGLSRSPLARLAWIQFFKRSPINFRPLLRVPKRRNPKGVALFILGLLEDFARSGDASYLNEATALGDWLLGERCPVALWKHSCWGYHFDWQAKAFYVPVGKPNVITTCYAARALLRLADAGGAPRFRDAALDAARFVVERLLVVDGGRKYIGYIPGEPAFVHNASLWGAALAVVGGSALNDDRLTDTGLEVARSSIAMQREDGAWRYGTLPHHGFVDGFHTGYNLEALDLIRRTATVAEFDAAIAKGLAYYRANFFSPEGMAKYYDTDPYPLDMHSVAQAVLVFLTVGASPKDRALMQRVLTWATDHLYDPARGRFHYQVTRRWKNAIDYTRWTQAWSYYALSAFNRRVRDEIRLADIAPPI